MMNFLQGANDKSLHRFPVWISIGQDICAISGYVIHSRRSYGLLSFVLSVFNFINEFL